MNAMNSVFSCQGLTEAILLFSRELKDEGFKATPARVHDILRGLPMIRIGDKREFRILLRANLVRNREELTLFDKLFESFWGERPDQSHSWPCGEEVEIPESKKTLVVLEEGESDETEIERIGASLEVVDWSKDFSRLDSKELKEVERLVLRIARRLGYKLARRFKMARKGRMIDFRSSFRQSLRHGGELFDLRYRRRRLRRLGKIYLLLDISGSMDVYGHFFFVFMYGLQRALYEAETFVFSTFLTYVTPYLKRFDFQRAIERIQSLSVNWSGGTDIGTSLTQLYLRHLGQEMDPRTVVIIVSDGWDRGDRGQLERAMKLIRHQAGEIFWLNPLLASPDYEPICQGMRCSLPFVDHFLPFYNLESLIQICNRLERIALG